MIWPRVSEAECSCNALDHLFNIILTKVVELIFINKDENVLVDLRIQK